MPATKRPKPIYQRGQFALYERPGRNLEIVWYDHERQRERSASAATRDPEQGRLAVDRKFLESEGAHHCPTCGRAWEASGSPLLLSLIADYLLLSTGKAGEKSARTRLGHVVRYINTKNPAMTAAQADQKFADAFRKWFGAEKITSGSRGVVERNRSLSSIEGALMQLAAAINAMPGQKAGFTVIQQKEVSASPQYRADVPTIAAMYNYGLRPDDKSVRHWRNPDEINANLVARRVEERANLLRYLRAAVATWARPDALYDLRKRQWHSASGVLDLNPPNRRQTRKHRPKVPVARQFAPHLNDMGDVWLPVASIRAAWDRMATTIGLPEHGEAGEKLIRRSMATIARGRIGEAQWQQGKMMLGHVRADISDIYAIRDTANLGLALAATESIIEEVESLAPGAFCREFTAAAGRLTVAA